MSADAAVVLLPPEIASTFAVAVLLVLTSAERKPVKALEVAALTDPCTVNMEEGEEVPMPTLPVEIVDPLSQRRRAVESDGVGRAVAH